MTRDARKYDEWRFVLSGSPDGGELPDRPSAAQWSVREAREFAAQIANEHNQTVRVERWSKMTSDHSPLLLMRFEVDLDGRLRAGAEHPCSRAALMCEGSPPAEESASQSRLMRNARDPATGEQANGNR